MSERQNKVMKLNTQHTIIKYSQLLNKLNYQPLRYSIFTILMYTGNNLSRQLTNYQ